MCIRDRYKLLGRMGQLKGLRLAFKRSPHILNFLNRGLADPVLKREEYGSRVTVGNGHPVCLALDLKLV